MPITAKLKKTGKVQTSLEIHSPSQFRLDNPRGEVVCPHCGGEMVLVGGLHSNRIVHFRHVKACTSLMESHPESLRHIIGKAHLKGLLAARLSQQKIKADVHIEYPLPYVGKSGRIADVAAMLPDMSLVVYECQLAPISVESLEQRSDDYENNGIEIVWFFGEKANTADIAQWSKRRFGDFNSITFNSDNDSRK